jgi:drug/metabolite transporter (DMT)-like permease
LHLRSIAYAFAASMMFGLGAVLAKLLSGAFDTSIIAVATLARSGLLVAALLALSRKALFPILRSLTRREWLDLFLMACPGTALPLLVIVAGFARTSELEGSLLLQSMRWRPCSLPFCCCASASGGSKSWGCCSS